MNGALGHDGIPPFRYNSRGSTPQRRDSSVGRVICWHCGQRGHNSTECPNQPTARMHEPPVVPSSTMGTTLPTAQPTAPHPKAGVAWHYRGQPCRSNPGSNQTGPRPPQSHASADPTHVATPQLTGKKVDYLRNHASWTTLVPIRQTEPTTRTPFVHL